MRIHGVDAAFIRKVK